jgi:DNA-binding CsgD family transcriptional regulator
MESLLGATVHLDNAAEHRTASSPWASRGSRNFKGKVENQPMPRLSRAQERARRQITRHISGTLPSDELARRLLAAIEEAIPADGHILWGLDPGTLLFNRVLAVSGTMVAHTPPFLRDLYLREPFPGITHPRLMNAGVPAVVLHEELETSWGLPRQALGHLSSEGYALAYRGASGPRGGLLRAFFGAAGEWLVALELVRYAPEWTFRRGDVAFARLIAPMVGNAFRAALARERGGGNGFDGDVPPSGVMVLDAAGQTIMQSPAATWWLDHLRAAEGHQVTDLPTAVWAAVAGLNAPASAAVSRLSTPTNAGALVVEATPGDRDGAIAVVLAPQRHITLSNALSHWPLTHQQRRVVELALRGWSDKQIAASLNVSEHTVGSHLRHVYAKLAVPGRLGLLSLFTSEIQRTWPERK